MYQVFATLAALTFSAPVAAEGSSIALSGITVADPDNTSLTVQLNVRNGSLTIGALNGATVAGGDQAKAQAMLVDTLAVVDATAGKKVIHRNAAARTKSRLSKAVASIK